MLIQTKNLCKTYYSGEVATQAICGINIKINRGEFVSIMGPSGSGKSTLMQILGFLDRPSEGDYFFEGKNTIAFSDDELAEIRNKKIGFVFQSFNLLPRTTVFENVELPLLYNRNQRNSHQNNQKVIFALKAVMLEHRINYFSNQLSGGEKQRVAIARALVNDPEIIFADEPTGNLDSKSGIEIIKILQNLNNKGKTIVLVTHETFTAEHAKRIIQLKDGKIVADLPIRNRRIANNKERLK